MTEKRYLSTKDVAALAGIRPASVWRLVKNGVLIEGVHFWRPEGLKALRWSAEAVEAWIEKRSEATQNDSAGAAR